MAPFYGVLKAAMLTWLCSLPTENTHLSTYLPDLGAEPTVRVDWSVQGFRRRQQPYVTASPEIKVLPLWYTCRQLTSR